MESKSDYRFKCLKNQKFVFDDFSIVPIRYQDRYEIMRWRNEQIYHLRQTELLTKVKQDYYFKTNVIKNFNEINPNQILFSYLRGECCIGYGGIVNIDWESKNAEISFLINTQFENLEFKIHWAIFLKLIEEVAFQEIFLHKIFTYAYDLRPLLYEVLEENEFKCEGRLIDHKKIDNKFIDVVIHSKLNINIYGK